jgi:hypothetical protein
MLAIPTGSFFIFIRTAGYDGNKEGITLDSNSKHKQHDL